MVVKHLGGFLRQIEVLERHLGEKEREEGGRGRERESQYHSTQSPHSLTQPHTTTHTRCLPPLLVSSPRPLPHNQLTPLNNLLTLIVSSSPHLGPSHTYFPGAADGNDAVPVEQRDETPGARRADGYVVNVVGCEAAQGRRTWEDTFK